MGGCVSSNLLNQEDDFSQLGSSPLDHHIVSLTSTTYGLLSLDPLPQSTTAPPTPPPPFTLTDSILHWSEPRPFPSRPHVINSCLDADSFRLSLIPNSENLNSFKENTHPNLNRNNSFLKQPFSLLKKTRIRKRYWLRTNEAWTRTRTRNRIFRWLVDVDQLSV